jgi:hypothetical protein
VSDYEDSESSNRCRHFEHFAASGLSPNALNKVKFLHPIEMIGQRVMMTSSLHQYLCKTSQPHLISQPSK